MIDRGSSELVPFLLRLKSLPLQFTGLGGSLQTCTVLLKSDVAVAHIEQGSVLQLLHFHLDLPLNELRALVVGLQRPVANRNGDTDLGCVVRVLVVKHGFHGLAEASEILLGGNRHGDRKESVDRGPGGVHELCGPSHGLRGQNLCGITGESHCSVLTA